MPGELILLLFAHWVGDYAMQTNAMAEKKGRSLVWLSIHVAAYMVPLVVVSFFLFRPGVIIQFLDINFGLHWITDFCTSRLALRVKDSPRLYYPLLGLDQFIHATALILTAAYVHNLKGNFQF